MEGVMLGKKKYKKQKFTKDKKNIMQFISRDRRKKCPNLALGPVKEGIMERRGK